MYYLNLDNWNKINRNSGLTSYNYILDKEETWKSA